MYHAAADFLSSRFQYPVIDCQEFFPRQIDLILMVAVQALKNRTDVCLSLRKWNNLVCSRTVQNMSRGPAANLKHYYYADFVLTEYIA